ncbi:MAG: hypothetical protein ACJ8AT_20675 [Hyalangium sp.]|uniref:hypothetical protein n=1 Tax=Hyalangium sp. TaxID=2028555 RepID=UPI00389A4B73
MTTINRTAGTAPAQAPAATDTKFDVQNFMQNGDEIKSAKALLGENSGYYKNFTKNLQGAIDKLGPNPKEADVKKAATNEMFKQNIMKFTTDRMSSQIMQKIKDMSSDGWA